MNSIKLFFKWLFYDGGWVFERAYANQERSSYTAWCLKNYGCVPSKRECEICGRPFMTTKKSPTCKRPMCFIRYWREH